MEMPSWQSVNKKKERGALLSKTEQHILSSLEACAGAHGVEIITVEVVGGMRSPIVRIYIDTDNGVSFNELSAAQEWIGQIVEQIDPFPGAYTLEVSSPGIDRPLRTLGHFEEQIGQECKIRLEKGCSERLNYKGIIDRVEGNTIYLHDESDTFAIEIDHIKKANIIGTIEF